MNDAAIIIFRRVVQDNIVDVDIEVPLDITANEFIIALNQTYELGIDTDDIKQCYLQCERPIVLLRGDRTLRNSGIRNATLIHFTN